MLYGCETWGFHSTNLLDTVKLRKSTPICMLYAELGCEPIDIHIKSRMTGYWISLVNSENTLLNFPERYRI